MPPKFEMGPRSRRPLNSGVSPRVPVMYDTAPSGDCKNYLIDRISRSNFQASFPGELRIVKESHESEIHV
jgi:hypothetical protein